MRELDMQQFAEGNTFVYLVASRAADGFFLPSADTVCCFFLFFVFHMLPPGDIGRCLMGSCSGSASTRESAGHGANPPCHRLSVGDRGLHRGDRPSTRYIV